MKRILLTSLIVGILHLPALGQTISQLETQLISLQAKLSEARIELDSLTVIYEERIQQIDREKERQKPDQSKIGELMSEALSISDQLEAKKKEISVIEDQVQDVRRTLDRKYSQQIDSLQMLLNAEDLRGDQESLEARIMQLSEKRLLVSPIVKRLSFDPQQILQIQSDAFRDSLDAAIYTDYLTNALQEVDAHLSSVKNTREEYEQIIKLQEKTGKFLDEVAEDQYGGIFLATESQGGAGTRTASSDGSGTVSLSEQRGIIQSQLQSYLAILHQLNWNDQIQQKSYFHSPVDSSAVVLTMGDYLRLLKDVEKELGAYKKIIQSKLEPQAY